MDTDSQTHGGDSRVPAEDLLPLVYEKLRSLAAHRMSRESPGHTLQATALVHEAWMRIESDRQTWRDRAQFYTAAAEAMRRILIESARRKQALRNGGNLERVDVDGIEIAAPLPDSQLLALHEALEQLDAHDGRKAELVKLRYFVGLTLEEAAGVLGISLPTAKRDWAYSRAWLMKLMREGDVEPPPIEEER